jgi:hypothetical protein
MIAALAAPLRAQTEGAILFEASHEAEHLTSAQTDQRTRIRNTEPALTEHATIRRAG